MTRTFIEALLVIFIAYLLVVSWSVYPRSIAEMIEVADRFQAPPEWELDNEKILSPKPHCGDDLGGTCPIVERRWKLNEPIKYSELVAFIKETNPDYYVEYRDSIVDNRGVCEERCGIFARATTDGSHGIGKQRFKVGIVYDNVEDFLKFPAYISISVREED